MKFGNLMLLTAQLGPAAEAGVDSVAVKRNFFLKFCETKVAFEH